MIDLAGKQGKVFVPLVYRLAARLEQLEWQEFAEDAPTAAFALRGSQRLFGLRALVSHYRLGAEAEACGVDLGRDAGGDWTFPPAPGGVCVAQDAVRQPPVVGLIDLTRRLVADLQGEAAVIAVVTGPRTLAGLLGDTPGLPDLYAGLARAYAEVGARMLLVAEDPRAAASASDTSAILGPLLNVARYFRLPAIVLADHAPRIPTAWLQDSPDIHPFSTPAGLVLTDGEVPSELPAERLRTWCDAFA